MVTKEQTAEVSSTKSFVSFLGPPASYTHQATLNSFKSDRYVLVPAVNIPEVFKSVQNGRAAFGVVPFENSTNGAVIFTLELLCDRALEFPDIKICAEAYLEVSHCLLGRRATNASPLLSGNCTPTSQNPSPARPITKPLSSLAHIERIYTHPQAWGQCEAFLGAYLKGIERIDVSSTSKAAEIVRNDQTGTSAAIASGIAADIHGLDVLARKIEDRADNKTRFFVLRKGVEEVTSAADGPTKSLISFTIDHKTPGALADVLDCFRRYELNLTSINSRPTKVVPFQYIFLVEFEGSALRDSDGRVASALGDVNRIAKTSAWLGSWNNMLDGE